MRGEVKVSTGAATDKWVEIDGTRLPANVPVVTSGQSVLADGSEVYVREKGSGARGQGPAKSK